MPEVPAEIDLVALRQLQQITPVLHGQRLVQAQLRHQRRARGFVQAALAANPSGRAYGSPTLSAYLSTTNDMCSQTLRHCMTMRSIQSMTYSGGTYCRTSQQ